MRDLFPIPRSLTGAGVRETLRRVSQYVPLDIVETPTGTNVFDWTLPPEWNIRDAWIADADGERLVDFRASSLHVVGYSIPVRARMRLSELRDHLHTHPTHQDRIPFRTSYYKEAWGFCLRGDQLEALDDSVEYDVCIDSSLAPGHVTYGEAILPGKIADEILLTTYCCHPALANDNLSGVALLAVLGARLAERPLEHSVRLLFSPGTIGPLTWLWRNEDRLDRIRHGLVVSCVGDPGAFTYKRTPRGDAVVDRAVAVVLRDAPDAAEIRDWVPWGGDERQFGSPGFDLPVGALSRTPADEFPEYHSSADDLDFVTAEALDRSLELILDILDVLDRNETYVNLSPKGEPQLGKRGLYRSVGGGSSAELALLWVLNQSDGRRDLVSIAERSGLPFSELAIAAEQLVEARLLAPAREL